MKFVLFSDLHLDATFRWAPAALGRRLRLALRETLDNICKVVIEHKADALLCAGDLYEQESFTPDTAEYLRATFANLAPTRVFIAPGNHDWCGPLSLYERVQWSSNVHIFTDSHLVPKQLDDGLRLWGAAHRAPANTDNFLHGFHISDSLSNIALFHGSERGFFGAQEDGKVAHAAFREFEIPAAGLVHAFVGHFHLPKDAEWLTYAGSPQPLAFGAGSGQAVFIELNGTETRRTRFDVAAVAFNDITVDVSGAPSMSEILERTRAAVAGLHGVARITLSGSLATTADLKLDDIRGISSDLEGLMVRSRDVVADYDVDAFAEEQTVRGQFVRDVQNSNLASEEKQRVLVVGLRALDGRADLEPL